jgi:hypothetical protein
MLNIGRYMWVGVREIFTGMENLKTKLLNQNLYKLFHEIVKCTYLGLIVRLLFTGSFGS